MFQKVSLELLTRALPVFSLFLLGYSTPILAQDILGKCGTVGSEEIKTRLFHNKDAVANGILQNRGGNQFYAPIKAHLIGRNDGSGRIAQLDVFEQVCQLNQLYEPFGLQFYLRDDCFTYPNNTVAFEDPSSNNNFLLAFRSANSINVYIAENATSPGGGGVTLAYYDVIRDWIVSRKDMIEALVPNVIPHEFGHFFSLMHPFNGWDAVPWDPALHGNPVTRAVASDNVTPVEWVSRDNCANQGDFLCSTPADYNLGFGWNGCTPYNGGCRDRFSQFLMPMQENTMGYFFGCGNYEFTGEQENLIIADYLSPQRSHIRDGNFTPVGGEIDEFIQAQKPASFSTTEYYDEVTFEWSAPNNANRYWLEVSSHPAFISKIVMEFVHTTSRTITTLQPNTTYYWRVKPMNDLDYCASFSSPKTFSTSDLSVNIHEISALEQFVVHPNPVAKGQQIWLQLETIESLDGDLILYHPSGKEVYREAMQYPAGLHQLNLNTSDFQKGMYILLIQTADGIASRKIILQ